MGNDYKEILKQADELARQYLEKGADSVSYKDLKGFEAVRELYYLARFEGEDAPEAIINFAEFHAKNLLQKLSREKRLMDKSWYLSDFSKLIGEGIGDANDINRPILVSKKEELLAVLKKGISEYEERVKNEYTSKLAKANEMAQRFLGSNSDDIVHGEKRGAEAVHEYYFEVFDITYPDSEQELEYALHHTDFNIKATLKALEDEATFTQQQQRANIDACLGILDGVMKKSKGGNKAILSKKRGEYLKMLNQEFDKHKGKRIADKKGAIPAGICSAIVVGLLMWFLGAFSNLGEIGLVAGMAILFAPYAVAVLVVFIVNKNTNSTALACVGIVCSILATVAAFRFDVLDSFWLGLLAAFVSYFAATIVGGLPVTLLSSAIERNKKAK